MSKKNLKSPPRHGKALKDVEAKTEDMDLRSKLLKGELSDIQQVDSIRLGEPPAATDDGLASSVVATYSPRQNRRRPLAGAPEGSGDKNLSQADRSNKIIQMHMERAGKCFKTLQESLSAASSMGDEVREKARGMQEMNLEDYVALAKTRAANDEHRRVETFSSNMEKFDRLSFFEMEVDRLEAEALMAPDEEIEAEHTKLGISLGLLEEDGTQRKCTCSAKIDVMKRKVTEDERRVTRARFFAAMTKQFDRMALAIDDLVREMKEAEEVREKEANEVRERQYVLMNRVANQKATNDKMRKRLKDAGLRYDEEMQEREQEMQSMREYTNVMESMKRGAKGSHGSSKGGKGGHASSKEVAKAMRRVNALAANTEKHLMEAHDKDGYADPLVLEYLERKARAERGNKAAAGAQTLTPDELLVEHGIMPEGRGAGASQDLPKSIQKALPPANWKNGVQGWAGEVTQPVETAVFDVVDACMGSMEKLEALRTRIMFSVANTCPIDTPMEEEMQPLFSYTNNKAKDAFAKSGQEVRSLLKNVGKTVSAMITTVKFDAAEKAVDEFREREKALEDEIVRIKSESLDKVAALQESVADLERRNTSDLSGLAAQWRKDAQDAEDADQGEPKKETKEKVASPVSEKKAAPTKSSSQLKKAGSSLKGAVKKVQSVKALKASGSKQRGSTTKVDKEEEPAMEASVTFEVAEEPAKDDKPTAEENDATTKGEADEQQQPMKRKKSTIGGKEDQVRIGQLTASLRLLSDAFFDLCNCVSCATDRTQELFADAGPRFTKADLADRHEIAHRFVNDIRNDIEMVIETPVAPRLLVDTGKKMASGLERLFGACASNNVKFPVVLAVDMESQLHFAYDARISDFAGLMQQCGTRLDGIIATFERQLPHLFEDERRPLAAALGDLSKSCGAALQGISDAFPSMFVDDAMRKTIDNGAGADGVPKPDCSVVVARAVQCADGLDSCAVFAKEYAVQAAKKFEEQSAAKAEELATELYSKMIGEQDKAALKEQQKLARMRKEADEMLQKESFRVERAVQDANEKIEVAKRSNEERLKAMEASTSEMVRIQEELVALAKRRAKEETDEAIQREHERLVAAQEALMHRMTTSLEDNEEEDRLLLDSLQVREWDLVSTTARHELELLEHDAAAAAAAAAASAKTVSSEADNREQHAHPAEAKEPKPTSTTAEQGVGEVVAYAEVVDGEAQTDSVAVMTLSEADELLAYKYATPPRARSPVAATPSNNDDDLEQPSHAVSKPTTPAAVIVPDEKPRTPGVESDGKEAQRDEEAQPRGDEALPCAHPPPGSASASGGGARPPSGASSSSVNSGREPPPHPGTPQAQQQRSAPPAEQPVSEGTEMEVVPHRSAPLAWSAPFVIVALEPSPRELSAGGTQTSPASAPLPGVDEQQQHNGSSTPPAQHLVAGAPNTADVPDDDSSFGGHDHDEQRVDNDVRTVLKAAVDTSTSPMASDLPTCTRDAITSPMTPAVSSISPPPSPAATPSTTNASPSFAASPVAATTGTSAAAVQCELLHSRSSTRPPSPAKAGHQLTLLPQAHEPEPAAPRPVTSNATTQTIVPLARPSVTPPPKPVTPAGRGDVSTDGAEPVCDNDDDDGHIQQLETLLDSVDNAYRRFLSHQWHKPRIAAEAKSFDYDVTNGMPLATCDPEVWVEVIQRIVPTNAPPGTTDASTEAAEPPVVVDVGVQKDLTSSRLGQGSFSFGSTVADPNSLSAAFGVGSPKEERLAKGTTSPSITAASSPLKKSRYAGSATPPPKQQDQEAAAAPTDADNSDTPPVKVRAEPARRDDALAEKSQPAPAVAAAPAVDLHSECDARTAQLRKELEAAHDGFTRRMAGEKSNNEREKAQLTDAMGGLHRMLVETLNEVLKRLPLRQKSVDDPYTDLVRGVLTGTVLEVLAYDTTMLSSIHKLLRSDSSFAKQRVSVTVEKAAVTKKLHRLQQHRQRREFGEEDVPQVQAFLDRQEEKLRRAIDQLAHVKSQIAEERQRQFSDFFLPMSDVVQEAHMPSVHRLRRVAGTSPPRVQTPVEQYGAVRTSDARAITESISHPSNRIHVKVSPGTITAAAGKPPLPTDQQQASHDAAAALLSSPDLRNPLNAWAPYSATDAVAPSPMTVKAFRGGLLQLSGDRVGIVGEEDAAPVERILRAPLPPRAAQLPSMDHRPLASVVRAPPTKHVVVPRRTTQVQPDRSFFYSYLNGKAAPLGLRDGGVHSTITDDGGHSGPRTPPPRLSKSMPR